MGGRLLQAQQKHWFQVPATTDPCPGTQERLEMWFYQPQRPRSDGGVACPQGPGSEGPNGVGHQDRFRPDGHRAWVSAT